MRPTRRGYVALAVVATAMLLARAAGPRSLNAVAAPTLVAVAAGAVQVWRAGEPRLERSAPRRGFPGETRPVELAVEGSGVASIAETVGEGLSGGVTVERSLPTTVSYEVTYERRGVHEIGPAVVRVRDFFGLFERTVEVDERTEVLVYPTVYRADEVDWVLGSPARDATDRTAFDRLREYVPGDSLRDVHWKTSAKRDDLLVTEYEDPPAEGSVAIAAAAAAGHGDAMATAAATLFVAATRGESTVGLTAPAGEVPPGRGERHVRRALELLARTGDGTVPERAWNDADVRVRADASGVTVSVDDEVYSLEDLTTARANPVRPEVVP